MTAKAKAAATGSATETTTSTAKKSVGERVAVCIGTVTIKKKVKGNAVTGDQAVILWIDPEVATLLNFRAPTDVEFANTLAAPDADGIPRGKLQGTRHGRTILIQRPVAEGTPAAARRYVQFKVPSNVSVAVLSRLFGQFMPTTVKTARVQGGYRFPITRGPIA